MSYAPDVTRDQQSQRAHNFEGRAAQGNYNGGGGAPPMDPSASGWGGGAMPPQGQAPRFGPAGAPGDHHRYIAHERHQRGGYGNGASMYGEYDDPSYYYDQGYPPGGGEEHYSGYPSRYAHARPGPPPPASSSAFSQQQAPYAYEPRASAAPPPPQQQQQAPPPPASFAPAGVAPFASGGEFNMEPRASESHHHDNSMAHKQTELTFVLAGSTSLPMNSADAKEWIEDHKARKAIVSDDKGDSLVLTFGNRKLYTRNQEFENILKSGHAYITCAEFTVLTNESSQIFDVELTTGAARNIYADQLFNQDHLLQYSEARGKKVLEAPYDPASIETMQALGISDVKIIQDASWRKFKRVFVDGNAEEGKVGTVIEMCFLDKFGVAIQPTPGGIYMLEEDEFDAVTERFLLAQGATSAPVSENNFSVILHRLPVDEDQAPDYERWVSTSRSGGKAFVSFNLKVTVVMTK